MSKLEKFSQVHLRLQTIQFVSWVCGTTKVLISELSLAGIMLVPSSENAKFCNVELCNEVVQNWIHSTQSEKQHGLWLLFLLGQRTVEVIVNEKEQAHPNS